MKLLKFFLLVCALILAAVIVFVAINYEGIFKRQEIPAVGDDSVKPAPPSLFPTVVKEPLPNEAAPAQISDIGPIAAQQPKAAGEPPSIESPVEPKPLPAFVQVTNTTGPVGPAPQAAAAANPQDISSFVPIIEEGGPVPDPSVPRKELPAFTPVTNTTGPQKRE